VKARAVRFTPEAAAQTEAADRWWRQNVVDEQRERHVREDDDAAIGAAIRDAVSGQL